MVSTYGHLGVAPPLQGITKASVEAIQPENKRLWVQLFFQKLADAGFIIDTQKSQLVNDPGASTLAMLVIVPNTLVYTTKTDYELALTNIDGLAATVGLLGSDGTAASTPTTLGFYKIPDSTPPELPKQPKTKVTP